MKVVDSEGKYELEVKAGGTIVYETPTGNWKGTDFSRMHDDYATKILPAVRGKKWVKCSDLTNYATSMIVPEMQKHLEWAAQNGMEKGCIVTDNVIKKMQIERGAGGKGSAICPDVFLTKEEAVEFLHSKGYEG